jgi:O-Antigen ligase
VTAGVVAALGLAVVIVGRGRPLRFAGLAAWLAGSAVLALTLAPRGHSVLYAVAAAVGLVVAGALAWLFLRLPWLVVLAVLACAPLCISVSVGESDGRLLLPLYAVVAGAALALAWQLTFGQGGSRELGALAWPLGLLVAWSGVASIWSDDRRQGAIYLLCYLLPFALLAASVARLSWSPGWATAAYVQLTVTALVFAVAGIWQYGTRDVFWGPRAIADGAHETSSWFYRVSPVFDGASAYGRFLVVAILASLVLLLFARGVAPWLALAAVTVTFVGLVPSFSQASYVALGAGILVALAALWQRWSLVAVAAAAVVVLGVSLGMPATRHRVLAEADLSAVADARTTDGVELAARHPLVGIGTGGFREPKADAAHDSPITVAAETGVPGLVLLGWLVLAAVVVCLRRNAVRGPAGRARLAFGLALVALVAHSLFADTLFQDPLFWAALGLAAVAARAEVPA